MEPQISAHFLGREPSAIRQAQIAFAQRPDRDQIAVVNLAIGNVSLPMHPAMRERLAGLGKGGGGFADGVVRYTASYGTEETQRAFLHVIASAGCDTTDLSCCVTDGGSQAMELMILGVCGPAAERPLMLLDPAYTNYIDMAKRAAVRTVSWRRQLGDDGAFTVPDLRGLEQAIALHRPLGLVIIPADNPTGQLMRQHQIVEIAKACVTHNLWLVSDEAYRQLHYTGDEVVSIWRLNEEEVPGITGRRISIESCSKVWNACGLRIGALVTDNPTFRAKTVAEYTANLCANAIGQYIFAALGEVPHAELESWYAEQRRYYAAMMKEVAAGLREAVPGIIVSLPDAALYSVLDVRRVVEDFDAYDFVSYCATEGKVDLEGNPHTLLVAPMGGFYNSGKEHGATQMRLAFVESPAQMKKVPGLFAALLAAYKAARRDR